MSFSSEQKTKIINEQHKNVCCRRALLSGILSAKARADGDFITLCLEKSDFCEFSAKLINEFFGCEPTISSSEKGGRVKKVSFKSKAVGKYLRSLAQKPTLFLEKCPSCAGAYLKGVFLACGSISDPQKQYMLGFSPTYNFEAILGFLEERSFSPKTTIRNQKNVMYVKKASEIEDFCGFLGLTDAMFDITNTQIEREFLNNTNRIVNCETNNIGKSVNASQKQIQAINQLIERNLLSMLPEELEYTAKLRIQNDSLSLSQLAKLFTPPISKSGLSHRLSKIIEITEHLLLEKS